MWSTHKVPYCQELAKQNDLLLRDLELTRFKKLTNSRPYVPNFLPLSQPFFAGNIFVPNSISVPIYPELQLTELLPTRR